MQVSHAAVHVRRRIVFTAVALLTVVALVLAISLMTGNGPAQGTDATRQRPKSTSDTSGTTPGTSTPSAAPKATAPPAEASDVTKLKRVDRITGKITPKSVVASPTGLVIANNMMYSHSMTLYDAKSHQLKATIPDSVDLTAFGVSGHPGLSQGAPVEAAFTSDGRYAYVSNYSMYGKGFGPHGLDECKPSDGYDPSYLYRVDTQTMKIDQVIEVGAVPKYVAITPDQKQVLVSNWCDYTLSIIDRAKATVTKTVKIGPMPRGVAITPDSKTAFVTAMWTSNVYKVDLTDPPDQAPVFVSPGSRMRHLDMAPDGAFLYAVSTGTDTVSKIDVRTGRIVAKVNTGREPRSMAISTDGKALYVVNYDASSMTKVRTSDMTKLQTVATDYHPIGITYEPTTHSVWVANYGGSILVFDDSSIT